MSAEKLPVEEGFGMLTGSGISQREFQLLEQYGRYAQEATALKRKLQVSGVRFHTRTARLKILETVLMPDLQRKIERPFF